MVKEGDIGINVGPTPSATGNDLILYDGNWVVNIMERSIWLDDESKWKLRFLEEGVCGRNRIESRTDVFWGAICIWRRCDA
jgi:hypothetical protein